MRRLVLSAVCAFLLAGSAFGGVFTPSAADVKKFLFDEFDVVLDADTGLGSFVLSAGDSEFEAWAFGGSMYTAPTDLVSGFVDINGVIKFAQTGTTGTGGPPPVAREFRLGESIGSSSPFTETTLYPTIPNLPAYFGVSITDPHFGWVQFGLPGGIGSVPTLLGQGIQPVPNIAIAAGANPIPEPSTLLLFAIAVLGAWGVRWTRRHSPN